MGQECSAANTKQFPYFYGFWLLWITMCYTSNTHFWLCHAMVRDNSRGRLLYLVDSSQSQTCRSPSTPRPRCTPCGRERLGQAGVSQASPGQRRHWVSSWAGHSAARWGPRGTIHPLCLPEKPAGLENMTVYWGRIIKRLKRSTNKTTDFSFTSKLKSACVI